MLHEDKNIEFTRETVTLILQRGNRKKRREVDGEGENLYDNIYDAILVHFINKHTSLMTCRTLSTRMFFLRKKNQVVPQYLHQIV